jgi:hypothetical protein
MKPPASMVDLWFGCIVDRAGISVVVALARYWSTIIGCRFGCIDGAFWSLASGNFATLSLGFGKRPVCGVRYITQRYS